MKSDRILGPMNLAVAAVMGIFLGIGISGSTGVVDFFHHWETLIAGMLAVVAGGMTVVAMLITDRHQQERHDKLISLNLRADRICVERAYDTVVPSLRRGSPGIRAFCKAVRSGLEISEKNARGSIWAIGTAVEPILRDMAANLNDEVVNQAERLFSAEMVQMRRRGIDMCNRAADRMMRLNTKLQQQPDTVSGRLIREFLDQLGETVGLVDRLTNSFERLGEQYAQ